MPRVCTVCRHPESAHINQELVAAHESLRSLSSRFHVSASSLHRHKVDHLPPVLMTARNTTDLAEAESLNAQMRAIRARLHTIVARAAATGDTKTELAALRELRNNAALGARATDQRTTVDSSVLRIYIEKVNDLLHQPRWTPKTGQ